MGIIDSAIDINELSQGKLVVIYGKSGSGKTKFASTFPKPMLYIRIGDDGSNTIKGVAGIKAVVADKIGDLITIAEELEKDKIYKSVLVDTFSLIVNEWRNENIVKKKKKMTQQAWGDLLTETEDIINRYHKISTKKWVILTGHEVMDSIEGMEDELLPDVRIAVSKGARTYLEGMANYGIHTLKLQREVEDKEGNIKTVVKYAANIGPDPYYWTKLQIDSSIKVPSIIINPTFSKLMKIVGLAE